MTPKEYLAEYKKINLHKDSKTYYVMIGEKIDLLELMVDYRRKNNIFNKMKRLWTNLKSY